jgi:hypothetical protein
MLVIHHKLLLIEDRAARLRGEEAGTIAVVTDDSVGVAAIAGEQAYNFFQLLQKERAPAWENKVTIKRFVF